MIKDKYKKYLEKDHNMPNADKILKISSEQENGLGESNTNQGTKKEGNFKTKLEKNVPKGVCDNVNCIPWYTRVQYQCDIL